MTSGGAVYLVRVRRSGLVLCHLVENVRSTVHVHTPPLNTEMRQCRRHDLPLTDSHPGASLCYSHAGAADTAVARTSFYSEQEIRYDVLGPPVRVSLTFDRVVLVSASKVMRNRQMTRHAGVDWVLE